MMGAEHQACLLLGSNMQPEKNLSRGVELLQQKVRVIRRSSVWQSQSIGSAGPDFLNLAVLIMTPMLADELKEKVLRPLEAQLGRVRGKDKNAPRPIDFDIILFDDWLLDESLWQYAHRAVPVAELLPDYRSSRGDILQNVACELAGTTVIHQRPNVFVDRKLHIS